MLKRHLSTIVLAVVLAVASFASLFVGVLDMDVQGLASGDADQWLTLLASRLPRLLAVLCTGVGMSVAGLIMQQLCMNKFVSPTTGATIQSAQLIVPNIVAMFKGDKIRGTLVDTALFGALFVLVCDLLAHTVIAPYELPIELIVGIADSLVFIGLLVYRLKHGRKAVTWGNVKELLGMACAAEGAGEVVGAEVPACAAVALGRGSAARGGDGR